MCSHPHDRRYFWNAGDGSVCAGCLDCGQVTRGAIDPDDPATNRPRPAWPARNQAWMRQQGEAWRRPATTCAACGAVGLDHLPADSGGAWVAFWVCPPCAAAYHARLAAESAP